MRVKLQQDFYYQTDVTAIARDLLGKLLVTTFDGVITSGRIVETEAYCGATDRACHAYPNKLTKRTKVMFQSGGIAYVYLCYGLHHLFNVVCNKNGVADAILVRAIEPVEGVHLMMERRKLTTISTRISAGPALVSQALGITTQHNATDLRGELIWIEDDGFELSDQQIFETTRIGVDYAGEDALLPWRYYIEDNNWVSKR